MKTFIASFTLFLIAQTSSAGILMGNSIYTCESDARMGAIHKAEIVETYSFGSSAITDVIVDGRRYNPSSIVINSAGAFVFGASPKIVFANCSLVEN
ncbi:MAG: hypothetical protein EOP09_14955 [Proteobacteria bacterium]|nr:MAG: hypothetical protein EOP09_14955 [Pseudomonadota bacterium]